MEFLDKVLAEENGVSVSLHYKEGKYLLVIKEADGNHAAATLPYYRMKRIVAAAEKRLWEDVGKQLSLGVTEEDCEYQATKYWSKDFLKGLRDK